MALWCSGSIVPLGGTDPDSISGRAHISVENSNEQRLLNKFYALLAQWLAHHASNVGVPGSSPGWGFIHFLLDIFQILI